MGLKLASEQIINKKRPLFKSHKIFNFFPYDMMNYIIKDLRKNGEFLVDPSSSIKNLPKHPAAGFNTFTQLGKAFFIRDHSNIT